MLPLYSKRIYHRPLVLQTPSLCNRRCVLSRRYRWYCLLTHHSLPHTTHWLPLGNSSNRIPITRSSHHRQYLSTKAHPTDRQAKAIHRLWTFQGCELLCHCCRDIPGRIRSFYTIHILVLIRFGIQLRSSRSIPSQRPSQHGCNPGASLTRLHS